MIASVVLWSGESVWVRWEDVITTQSWPSQSWKESTLNCLLVEQQPFIQKRDWDQSYDQKWWSESWHLLIGGASIACTEVIAWYQKVWVYERPGVNLSWNESERNWKVFIKISERKIKNVW